MIITPEQAYAIIASDKRLVLDEGSEQKVFFTETIDDIIFAKADASPAETKNEAKMILCYYDEYDDECVAIVDKETLDKCEWHLDRDYIEADLGDCRKWCGRIYVVPEEETAALVS